VSDDEVELSDDNPQIRRNPPFSWRIVWAVALSVLLAFGLQTGYTTWAIANSNAQAKKAGILLEHKLCHTLHELAKDNPPSAAPGVPSGPGSSRYYLETQHSILAQLEPDVGCLALERDNH
jgi:hypothetical protein